MIKLKPYQKEARQFAIDNDGRALFAMAPGTGKTITAKRYRDYEYILAGGKFWTLILGRRDDYMTWRDELLGDGESIESMVFIESGTDSAIHSLMHDRKYWSKIRWVMVSYDLVKAPAVMDMIRACEWDLVIGDEVHYIKHSKSKRTKCVLAAVERVPHRLGLTGSPITNEPSDLFTIGKFVDGGKTFGTNEWKFMHRYYLKSGRGWYKRRDAKSRLVKQLGNLAYCIDEDDPACNLKLPPKRYVIECCKMTGMQRRYYEQVLENWEIKSHKNPDKYLEINYAIVQLAKLRQIASGFYYNEDKEAVWLKSGKMEKLFRDLNDPDHLGQYKKLVIWCSHTAEIKYIARHLRRQGKELVTFRGSDTSKLDVARVQFKNDPLCQYFVAQVDKGVGMNQLVVSSAAVYVSNSLKVVSRQQSERRTRRIGSEHHDSICYYDYITEGTVDKSLRRDVMRAKSFAETVLNAVREGMALRTVISE